MIQANEMKRTAGSARDYDRITLTSFSRSLTISLCLSQWAPTFELDFLSSFIRLFAISLLFNSILFYGFVLLFNATWNWWFIRKIALPPMMAMQCTQRIILCLSMHMCTQIQYVWWSPDMRRILTSHSCMEKTKRQQLFWATQEISIIAAHRRNKLHLIQLIWYNWFGSRRTLIVKQRVCYTYNAINLWISALKPSVI